MMRNSRIGITALVACLALTATMAAAQEEEGPAISPIELYACHFNDGKSMDDLMAVTHAWNLWMNEQGRTDYWASLLVPYYHSKDIDFDVAWAGGWPDGATMAASTEFWLAEGGELQEAFQEAVTCDRHGNYAVLTLRESSNVGKPGPVQFSNCSIKEGHSFPEVMTALNEWAAYEGAEEIDIGSYVLFSIYGETSDADYSFKWVNASSWEQFGKSWDHFAGGGWRKSQELFGELLDCDSGRVYQAMPVRAPGGEE